MDFLTEQKNNALEAGLLASSHKNEIIKLAGNLLTAIANHPSLLESTYEYNEDIQNAVNELSEEILFKNRLSKFLEILEQDDNESF